MFAKIYERTAVLVNEFEFRRHTGAKLYVVHEVAVICITQSIGQAVWFARCKAMQVDQYRSVLVCCGNGEFHQCVLLQGSRCAQAQPRHHARAVERRPHPVNDSPISNQYLRDFARVLHHDRSRVQRQQAAR